MLRKRFNVWYVGLILICYGSLCPALANAPYFRTIQRINQEKLNFGTYLIEGYAAQVSHCPPCPEGMVCEVCAPTHVVVSEDKISLENYKRLSPKEIILFLPEEISFETGKAYQFLIQIIDAKTIDQSVTHARLIHYQKKKLLEVPAEQEGGEFDF